MANYVGSSKKRLMAYSASLAATGSQTVPTDTRGMSAVGFDLSVGGVSGGADTLDVKIQGSHDKSTWFDTGISFTQATAATSESKRPTAEQILPRWVRGYFTVGAGATATTVYLWCTYERRGPAGHPPTAAGLTPSAGAIA